MAVLTQTHYRGRVDVGESDIVNDWIATQNTDWIQDSGSNFRVRLAVYNSDVSTASAAVLQWQYSLNGGDWTSITTTSSVIKAVDGTRVNGANCGQHYLNATGTHIGANGYSEDGTSGPTDIQANFHAEHEMVCQLVAADLRSGDVVRVRASHVDLNAWDEIPSITAAVPGSPPPPSFEETVDTSAINQDLALLDRLESAVDAGAVESDLPLHIPASSSAVDTSALNIDTEAPR